VTDANLLLGRLDAQNFLGGEMALDVARARAVMEQRIAKPLGMSVEDAALGVVRIADAKMSLAVREVSVAKGHDPRDFALVVSGGGGPLHGAAIARELSIPTVIVPELPGTFSAVGMLHADVRHDHVQTHIRPMAGLDIGAVNTVFARMAAEATATLAKDRVPTAAAIATRSMDLRYRGQEYTLTVPVPGGDLDNVAVTRLRKAFDELHYAQYQHAAPEEPVEIVNLRLSSIGRFGAEEQGAFKRMTVGMPAGPKTRRVRFDSGIVDCPIWQRSALAADQVIDGPAVIEETVSTTILHPGDRARMHPAGPLIIEIGST
jgi:N-methylhydantoinase A